MLLWNVVKHIFFGDPNGVSLLDSFDEEYWWIALSTLLRVVREKLGRSLLDSGNGWTTDVFTYDESQNGIELLEETRDTSFSM